MEGHATRRLAKARRPPKILTNNYWPVRQKILSRLSLDDKRALGKAYPGLKIKEDGKFKRQKLERARLLRQMEIFNTQVLECDTLLKEGISHSHFCHPIMNTIQEKQHASLLGGDVADKTREINQFITNISKDINKLPPISTELCLSVAPKCWLQGYTALHVAAGCDDVETVRRLIEKGADMYRFGGWFQGNCLHAAVHTDSIDVGRFMVTEMNMDKEQREEGGLGQTVLELINDYGPHYLDNFEEWIQLFEN